MALMAQMAQMMQMFQAQQQAAQAQAAEAARVQAQQFLMIQDLQQQARATAAENAALLSAHAQDAHQSGMNKFWHSVPALLLTGLSVYGTVTSNAPDINKAAAITKIGIDTFNNLYPVSVSGTGQ
jgi:hypothetical protein